MKSLNLLLPVLLLVRAASASDEPVRLDSKLIPKLKPPAKVAHDQNPIHVKVLSLEFNPSIPAEIHSPGDPAAKPMRIRDLGKWQDPLVLAAGYIQDVCDASGGFIQYEIIEWIDTKAFQKKTDGYTYTPREYFDCMRKTSKWHEPDAVDYAAAFEQYKIIPRIESGEIDEVWFFGAPYFGYLESVMAGKGAFYINGGPLDQIPCKRPFAVMGFNYERGVAEMLHDLCHRTESTMSRVSGGWKCEELTSDWARFAANDKQSNGVAAVGTCHWPPNAEKDYDYANPRQVMSSADDWLTYPKLAGAADAAAAKKPLTCEAWGGPDYHRNYMKWWFAHFPKATGRAADGRQNNWWKYVFDYWGYDEKGAPKGG